MALKREVVAVRFVPEVVAAGRILWPGEEPNAYRVDDPTGRRVGVSFRKSRDLADKDMWREPAEFGATLRGQMVDGWLEVEVPAKTSGPRLELVDVEVIDFPSGTYFKIAVWRDAADDTVHHVTKRYADLQVLNEAVAVELGQCSVLHLPHVRSEAELADPRHRLRLAAYLDTLAQSPEIAESDSFHQFFHLSEDYQSSGKSSVPVSDASLAMLSTRVSLSDRAKDVKNFVPGLSKLLTPDGACLTSRSDASTALSSGLGSSLSLTSKEDDECLCVICWERPSALAVVPCGHLAMCEACGGAVSACPVCRGAVERTLKIFTA